MKAVNPLAVRIVQSLPVLAHGQRSGLEPPHLRGRDRLRIDGAAAHHLTHDGIEGETISIVDVLVARQSLVDRLAKQPVPVDGILALTAVAQRRRREIGQPKRVTKLAHYQKTAVRTELCAPKFQPYPVIKIHPITPPETRTLRVIHEALPSLSST